VLLLAHDLLLYPLTTASSISVIPLAQPIEEEYSFIIPLPLALLPHLISQIARTVIMRMVLAVLVKLLLGPLHSLGLLLVLPLIMLPIISFLIKRLQ
jgi:hypothetical protein